jgi:DNA-binding SARP family transcriptional activator/Tfp pilus assembly protein PilF
MARSLLAYLLTYRDRPHTRDLLAGTFWPDLPDATARRRLTQALWQIRHALEPHPILATEGDTVQLDPHLPLWLDVEEFIKSGAQCIEGGPEAIACGELCIEQYRGEFLAGYYDDWIVLERERLQEIFLETLGRLVEAHKSRGEYERALVCARRLALEDPWREEAHREAMRLYHLLGQDAEALMQFELCRQVLAEELDAEPSPETVALAGEIASQSRLVEPPVLPSAARPVAAPPLERPDRLPLVGRRSELPEMLRHVEAACEGNGGLTIIYGEAGVGKSRLLRELAANAQWRGVQTVWGRCYELAAPPAYQPLVEALRAGLPALAESAMSPLWRAELSRLLPELTTGEGGLPSLSPEEEKRRLLEAIARAFLTLAEATPCLVCLEDAHWMDRASLEALHYLLPRLADSQLLVALTIRTEELAGQQGELVSAMESTRLPRCLELDRLGSHETGELVQRALDLDQPAPLFSARLHAETEGNPFYLIEMLWALVEEGLLHRDQAGGWSTPWDASTEDYAELPMPAGVVQSIERRLERLPDTLQELLGLAAVIGRSLGFQLWLSASGQDEEVLLAAGDDLCARGLLLTADPETTAGADYAFAHDQIRRVTYRRLAPPRRRLYHRRVAQALTNLAPDQPAALAYHWTQAQVWDQAAEYHRQAGDRAQRVYATADVVAHYSAALKALERLPETVDPALAYDLRLARVSAYDLMGEKEARADDIEALAALAEALDDDRKRAEVARCRASFADTLGDYPVAIESAQELIRLAQAAQDVKLEAEGYRQWGRALWRQGKHDDARRQLGLALTLAQRASLRSVEAESLCDLGTISGQQGDYDRARVLFRQSLQLFRDLGHRRNEALMLGNLGTVNMFEGHFAKAWEYYQQVLRIFAEIGDRRSESLTLTNLGDLSRKEGDYVGARAYYERSLRICRETGDRLGGAGALFALGRAARALGDYAVAMADVEQAMDVYRKIGHPHSEASNLWEQGMISHLQGDDRLALERASQALQIAQTLGDRHTRAAALTIMAHARLGLADPAGAATAYQEAVGLRRELGQHNLVIEALAGLARTALTQDDRAQALGFAEEILAHLETGTLDGTHEPLRIYLTLYHVLDAMDDPRAGTILVTAYSLLQERAEVIPDEDARRSFLENVSAHREIVREYQELQTSQQESLVAVSLPRIDAPLGRPLREDEYVEVSWALDAPEDEAVQGKVPRRRQQILRLLRQAHSQGAAPRDEDLAEALGVSLATIRRDMAALRDQGHDLPTRWRKMTT